VNALPYAFAMRCCISHESGIAAHAPQYKVVLKVHFVLNCAIQRPATVY